MKNILGIKNRIRIIGLFAIYILSTFFDKYSDDFYNRVVKSFNFSAFNKFDIFIVIILILIVSILVFANVIVRWFVKFRLYFDGTLEYNFVYESVNTELNYVASDGSQVSFKREDHISRISKKQVLKIPIDCDGRIDRLSVSSINSYYTFPSSDKVVFYCAFEDDNIVDDGHRSSYALMMHDSFCKKEEYWIFATYNYCKFYRLKIVLPKEIFDSIRLFKMSTKSINLKSNSSGEFDFLDQYNVKENWAEVEDPKYIIQETESLMSIIVDIHGLRNTERYMVKWSLK